MLGNFFCASLTPLSAAALKVPSVIGPGRISATFNWRLVSACAHASTGNNANPIANMNILRIDLSLLFLKYHAVIARTHSHQNFFASHDVTKLLDDCFQRCAMLVVGQRRAAVGN